MAGSENKSVLGNDNPKALSNFMSVASLQVGDILLSTTEGFVSDAVKATTRSKFSHARLYIGGNEVIEAIDPEVVRKPVNLAIENDNYTHVYRYPNLTDVQQAAIVNYAKSQDGKEYDLSGALSAPNITSIYPPSLLSKLYNLHDSEFDFYCSELVAFSYKSAGIRLEFAASQTTPEDLAVNKKLKYIGRLK